MYRQKDRQSLIVCLASVLELDQPVQAVAEDRRHGERWSFDCFRTIEQWKVTPGRGKGCVFGHNTGFKWKFFDTRSCTHIEVSRREQPAHFAGARVGRCGAAAFAADHDCLARVSA